MCKIIQRVVIFMYKVFFPYKGMIKNCNINLKKECEQKKFDVIRTSSEN